MKTFLKKLSITAICTSSFCAAQIYAQNLPTPQPLQAIQPMAAQQPQFLPNSPNGAVQANQQPPDDRVSYEHIFPQIQPDKQKIGLSFLEKYWDWLLTLAAATAAVAYFIFRPKKTPPKTPFELAMEAVNYAVASSDGLTEKEYASQISLAVRAYIESEHNIPAPVKTTQEFLKIAAKSIVFDKDERELLAKILNISDMAKFAKNQFSNEERTQLASVARKFLESDKLRCEMKRDISKASDDPQDTTKNSPEDISVEVAQTHRKKNSPKEENEL